MKTINLIYIGEEFYLPSNTVMFSIHIEKSFERYDWELVTRSLKEGKIVNIRPANDIELKGPKDEFWMAINNWGRQRMAKAIPEELNEILPKT